MQNYSLQPFNLTILFGQTFRVLTASNYPHDSTFAMNYNGAPLQFVKEGGNRTRSMHGMYGKDIFVFGSSETFKRSKGLLGSVWHKQRVRFLLFKDMMDISDVFMINLGIHYFSSRESIPLKMREVLGIVTERWKTVFRDILQVLSDASFRHRKGEEKTLIWRMTYPYLKKAPVLLDMVSKGNFEELEEIKNEEAWLRDYVKNYVRKGEGEFQRNGGRINFLDFFDVVEDRLDLQWFYWNESFNKVDGVHIMQDRKYWEPFWIVLDANIP